MISLKTFHSLDITLDDTTTKEIDRQKNKLSMRDRKSHGASQYHHDFLGYMNLIDPDGSEHSLVSP